MSTRKTKRQSGSFYKKERERKHEEKVKLSGALEKFLQSRDHEPENIRQSSIDTVSQPPSTSTYYQPEPSTSTHSSTSTVCQSTSTIEKTSSNLESESTTSNEAMDSDQEIECTSNIESLFKLDDPGMWPTNLTQNIIDTLIENGPNQIDSGFSFPADESGRKFNYSYFYKTLVNGEKTKRTWLCYSVALNSIFCFPCKLFGKDKNLNIVSSGYSDWRHCSDYLNRHENSIQHLNSIKTCCELKLRLNKNLTIDKDVQSFYNREKNRWRAIIERMIAIVQFLASQNLAFRGSTSELYKRDNGNFLKAVEMIAKFDSVISEHLNNIKKSKESHKRLPQYLGIHFQNEIIDLIAGGIKREIIKIVKDAKYFSIILDSTPDVSHAEQITFVVRCVNVSADKVEICEFFLGFFPVTNTTGEGLSNFLLQTLLPGFDLNVEDIRGQGYDNGANMRGKNIGLQRQILNINPKALYIPCAAHTLNLVVNDAATATGEITGFFDTVQEVYIFLSSSTYRWDVLKKHIKTLTLKPLSDTRWESRINAIRPLRQNLKNIVCVLSELIADPTRDAKTKQVSSSLINKLKSFKFICSIIIWHDLLSRINIVSKMLQNSKLNIAECTEALKNLGAYVSSQRTDESFEHFLSSASSLANELEVAPYFPETRKRKKSRHFDYENNDDVLEGMEGRQQFKTGFYFTLLDHAISSIDERFNLLWECESLFNFLYQFYKMNDDDLKKACFDLDIKLQITKENKTLRDLDGVQLCNEITLFRDLFPIQMLPYDILTHIIKNDLVSCFPNFAIALRIFLTLPISVASGERSFSKLKIIKNYLRSTMAQERLTNLAIISIESDISENLDMSQIINDFASKKARKVHL